MSAKEITCIVFGGVTASRFAAKPRVRYVGPDLNDAETFLLTRSH